jgi:hypothetical protein
MNNALSKKIDNHIFALSLYFVFYNFTRIHKSLRMSPAMSAGIADQLWLMENVAAMINARAAKPAKRGPYRKRVLAQA